MNILKICNYKIFLTDSCFKYFSINNIFFYKIFVKNKGNFNSKTIIYFSKKKNNFFNKIISINKINFIIDFLSLCFLNNTCIHFKIKVFINSPNSNKNLFNENKCINKIIFLLKFVINKKLYLHNGYIKILNFNFKEKNIFIMFLGNCNSCNIKNSTLNNFIIKIFKKINIKVLW